MLQSVGQSAFFWLFLCHGLTLSSTSSCMQGKLHTEVTIVERDRLFLRCIQLNQTEPKEIARICTKQCCDTRQCSAVVLPTTSDYQVNCCLVECEKCKFEPNPQFNTLRIKRSSKKNKSHTTGARRKTTKSPKTDSKKTSETTAEAMNDHTEAEKHESTSSRHEKMTPTVTKGTKAATTKKKTTPKQTTEKTTPKQTSEKPTTTTKKPTTTTKKPTPTTMKPTSTSTTTTTTKKPTVTTTRKPTPAPTKKFGTTKKDGGKKIVSVKAPQRPSFGLTKKDMVHRDVTTTASLVTALSLGILFLTAVTMVCSRRLYESWKRRHYTQVDYLINGMYN